MCIYGEKYVGDILKYLRHIFDYLPCIFNYLREVFYHVKKYFFSFGTDFFVSVALRIICRIQEAIRHSSMGKFHFPICFCSHLSLYLLRNTQYDERRAENNAAA